MSKILIITLIIIIILFSIKPTKLEKPKYIEKFAEPELPNCIINETKTSCDLVDDCTWYNEKGYRPMCQLKVLPDKYKMLYNCVIQPTEWACNGLPACSWFEKDVKRVCVLKELTDK